MPTWIFVHANKARRFTGDRPNLDHVFLSDLVLKVGPRGGVRIVKNRCGMSLRGRRHQPNWDRATRAGRPVRL